MEVQEQFEISARHPTIGYGDGQFTAFASDLGIVAGEVPTVINLSPKSGRTIQFVLERTAGGGDYFFYKPSPAMPARLSHLSMLIFND